MPIFPPPPITYIYQLFTSSTVRHDTQDRNRHFDTVSYLELLIPRRQEYARRCSNFIKIRRCSNFIMIFLLF